MRQIHHDIQGNTLKPHGRDFQFFILLKFIGPVDTVKKWISNLKVTSLEDQVNQAKQYRNGSPAENCFTSFFLSYSGYKYLDFTITPNDSSFENGFVDIRKTLGNPSDWESSYEENFDAALLLASDDLQILESELSTAIIEYDEIVKISVLEKGGTIRDNDGFAKEPFGFRDGISNPDFLSNSLSDNKEFDSSASPELVLTSDPFIENGFGSFVSIAKFEQDIEAFISSDSHKLQEPKGVDEIIGRRKDGTPNHLNHQSDEQIRSNNWDFTSDPQGKSCPFHSHVRKMNDRSESLKKGKQYKDERIKRIARRGFTFFNNETDLNLLDENAKSVQVKNEKINGVGTYFISYQASITGQFEKLIKENAFNSNYFEDNSGLDSLLSNTTLNAKENSPDTGKKFLFLRGGAYLYAPPISFLRNINEVKPIQTPHRLGTPSTERTSYLRNEIIERGFSNRKDEWLTDEMLGNILIDNPELKHQPVIVRKALASKKMLKVLVSEGVSKITSTYFIDKGELIVGVIPMGSVGLGKVFPKYLTDEEQRISSNANRDETSVFGHTVPNYKRILEGGLIEATMIADKKLASDTLTESQRAFYNSTKIVCEAVVDYSNQFSLLAERMSGSENDVIRKNELRQIAQICSQIPNKPAKSFHEALQFIWFIHLAQSAFCAFNSLGRLDQVLDPYLSQDLKSGVLSKERAIELIECFLIKMAHRLNLNPATLKDQDHLSYGTGIGTRPIYLDQIASCNNFIQNIVLGGIKPDGSDGVNTTTYLFLEALGNVGLATPTINVRVGKSSPDKYLSAIDRAIRFAGNGHPILFNEDTVIEGLKDSGISEEESNDFALAGCWEPMLHGKNSFIFGMVNMLQVIECALNEGMLFNADRQFLTGQKQSVKSPKNYNSFEELMIEVKKHLQFFSDKVAIGTCSFFQFPSSMSPTPFLSVLLDGCLERGMDQSEGGADFNVISNIAFAIPNAVNALANIKKFVFEEKKWSFEEVRQALELNWGLSKTRDAYDPIDIDDEILKQKLYQIRRTFLKSEYKFGNNNPFVEPISSNLMDMWYECAKNSEKLAKKAYLDSSNNSDTLRLMSNYPAANLKKTMRNDIDLIFTIGTGTFGQYSSMGKGVSASADGRMANEALAPNCSPTAGTALNGIDGLFKSLNNLNLERLGGAAVTDIRINGVYQEPDYFKNVIKEWVENNGNMLTVSVLSTSEIMKMIELVESASSNPELVDSLKEYSDRFCRVGGWNSGFICLPRPQQRDHLLRATLNKL